MNLDITTVKGWDENLWRYVFMKLNTTTRGQFSCFFKSKVLKNERIFNDFAWALGEQFATMKANRDVYQNRDFSLYTGGWNNGEIGMKQGLGEYLNPNAHGKSMTSGFFLVDPLLTLLQAYGLTSRLICYDYCNGNSTSCNACKCETLCIGGQVV